MVVQAYGEVFKNVIARELGDKLSWSGQELRPAMDLLIELHPKFELQLKLECRELYFKLIVDYAFKRYLM